MQRSRAGTEIAFAVAAQPRRAYLATPASGRGHGVLVVHEAQGLGELERDVCDRLAREGFVALAPDWHGAAAPADVLDAAALTLLSREACEGARIAALGFGWGGPLAQELASRSPRIAALACCWPSHPGLAPDLGKSSAACLALFAERDPDAPPEAARALEGRLRAAGRRAAVQVMPGVSPGFLDAGRPTAFDATAALRAWDLLLGFLRAELA
jgi:carboxymethylenebutenolidase